MAIYADKFETKEKQKLPEIKNLLQHIRSLLKQNHFTFFFTCEIITTMVAIILKFVDSALL